MTNWDTQTADRCTLPELIRGTCQRCRDRAYCYRQRSLFELKDEKAEKEKEHAE